MCEPSHIPYTEYLNMLVQEYKYDEQIAIKKYIPFVWGIPEGAMLGNPYYYVKWRNLIRILDELLEVYL